MRVDADGAHFHLNSSVLIENIISLSLPSRWFCVFSLQKFHHVSWCGFLRFVLCGVCSASVIWRSQVYVSWQIGTLFTSAALFLYIHFKSHPLCTSCFLAFLFLAFCDFWSIFVFLSVALGFWHFWVTGFIDTKGFRKQNQSWMMLVLQTWPRVFIFNRKSGASTSPTPLQSAAEKSLPGPWLSRAHRNL